MNKLIDNRNAIRGILNKDFEYCTNEHNHIFYVVQVLLRKKDGCEKDNYPVYQKIIDTPEKIDKIFNDAVYYAEKYNGRVYLTVSPKIKEKVSLRLAKAFIDYSDNCDKSPEAILYSTATMSGNSCCPRIIFDFDGVDRDKNGIGTCINNFFGSLQQKYGIDYFSLPTINGFHVIADLIIDYTSDEVVDLMTDEFKQLIKDVYYFNNDVNTPKHFKTMLKDMLHKESGNILVYFKK